MTTRVIVVYASTWGNTRRMAESVTEGAASVPNTEVVLKEADDAMREDGLAADALIVGSPVRHRSADARVKAFVERVLETLWLSDRMIGKVGAVFTVGGGYGDAGAGCELTQLGLLAAMAANGMLVVPLPKTTPGFGAAGTHWGPHGRSGGPAMEPVGVTDAMLLAAYHHGANVARVAACVRGKDLFAVGNVAPSPELARQFGGEMPG
jgi:NAD(P)H dehydrogenase (quinone)